MKIPLNPHLLKGDLLVAPLGKGGMGGVSMIGIMEPVKRVKKGSLAPPSIRR